MGYNRYDVNENYLLAPRDSTLYSLDARQRLKTVSKITYLETSIETTKQRVKNTTRGIVGLQNKTFEELYTERVSLYKQWADYKVDAENNAEKVVREIQAHLGVGTSFF
jgi:shikimate kinase